jgi:hypothetical protein
MKIRILALLAACGGGSDHGPVPPKAPNNELIVGEFQRRPEDGTTAIRFRADGSVTLAHDPAKLDGETLATGTFQLDHDQLTLSYDKGMCAGRGPGVYKVVISKIGIRFTKMSDTCDQRAKIDGQIWRRL